MSMIKCPECGKDISDKAISCPGCGCPMEYTSQNVKNSNMTVINPSNIQKTSQNASNTQSGTWAMVKLWGFIILFFGGLLLLGNAMNKSSSSSSKSSSDTDSYSHDKYDAQVLAEKEVKNRLKSPSSADFCWSPTVSRSGNTWTVSGYVDAQNSFGATVRSNYTVKITFTSKDYYRVDSCSIK